MNRVQAEYRNRRVVHALRPTPIVAHKITPPVRVHLSRHLIAAEIGCVIALMVIIAERLL